jgi:DNA-directed RNA polymerase sigma subunit (sigma70/sigma32)
MNLAELPEEAINLALNRLFPREKNIVVERVWSKKTYQQIADEQNVCATIIRNIFIRAMGKMKKPYVLKQIKELAQ